MADIKDYQNSLSAALEERRDWLEKTELVKLKEELRTYQTSFSSLYTIYLKKGLINEDPYKQEAKIGEIEVPETGLFSEAERIEQLSIRLANFDNQLDFLVNFYQFGVEFLNLDRIKRILGLVRYIDWVHLIPDSQSANTRAVAEITVQSKTGVDSIALSVIGGSLTNLSKSTAAILVILKELADYHREAYKLEVRNAVAGGITAAEANAAAIKKKFAAALPGKPFYQELVEEIIKEDYSPDGPMLRQNILNSLKVAEAKPKTVTAKVSFKMILLEGIQVIGSVCTTLHEISVKLDENETLLANQKKSFWEKVKQLVQQMMNKEAEEVVYDVEYLDPTKGVPVKEKVHFHHFRNEMDRKNRVLASLGPHGAAHTKLEAMQEEQLIAFLEKNIREVQSLHRTLTALDEFFKTEAPREDRDKVKGIKPELAAVKNAIVRANQLRHEYSAQKEEEEQMRRLGISPEA
ncbi:MAG: hypothetical protein LBE14_04620 [Treponema sp.]|jgi:hypothetical protein|nr:hypothetical protein [Treponema sp.]